MSLLALRSSSAFFSADRDLLLGSKMVMVMMMVMMMMTVMMIMAN
jgi:hypothetical protein